MHWIIIGVKPAYYLKLFWSMWCPKISSSRSLCKGMVLYPAKNEEIYGIVPHQKFLMSCYNTFKKKTSTYGGHKWVICGSHPDCSVGQWVKWVNRCDPLSTLGHTFYNRPCLTTGMLVHTCFYIWLLFTEKCKVWLTIAKQHTVKWSIELMHKPANVF